MNSVRTMTGTALLWAGLATQNYVSSSEDPTRATIVAILGFVAFAAGLALFSDGLKRGIIEKLRAHFERRLTL